MLLKSFDTGNVVGLRDRAIIATLIFTAARIGAVAGLRTKSSFQHGDHRSLRFNEKRGKEREIPVRRDLDDTFSLIWNQPADWAPSDSPLFRSTTARSKRLTERGSEQRRHGTHAQAAAEDARLPEHLSPHSFRVATITDLLAQGVPLEDVQFLAGHADPRTTRLYDRRKKKVARRIVEQITIAVPPERT